MAQINRTKASLRIAGEFLNPLEVSNILGCNGTTMYSKDDVKVAKKSGRKIIRKHGLWLLETIECEPENIDGQVSSLLEKLSDDISVWINLSAKYEIDLFCGFFMKESNEGMEISATTLVELGKRGISLSLDIYDGAN